MDPEELRQQGHRFIDWLADFHAGMEGYPVRSQVRPGEVRGALPGTAPADPESYDAIVRDLERVIVPGLTHWQSPRFFAYFPANISAASVLGELTSAAFGIQGMSWTTSPSCTELETVVLDWMREALGLPEAFGSSGEGGGVIQDSASSATLCAMLAARERVTGGEGNARGLFGRAPMTVYGSAQAHSSFEKAARVAGIGSAQVRMVDTDAQLRMRPEALAAQLDEDLARGHTPCMVNAVVGTTSTNAIDPLREIGEVCRARGVWLHVDAAMSGISALCPEHRDLQDGVALADSYTTNAHKWMLTNFDCNLFWVRDRGALTGALGAHPAYLDNRASASGEVIDYKDWQIPLGRRFRALKLWFVLRRYGTQALADMVREHVALARRFAGWVETSERFELFEAPPLNLVCFAHRDGEAASRRLLEACNDGGEMYLTHTRVDGRYLLRMSIGGATTSASHVERAWSILQRTAAAQAEDPVGGRS